MIGGVIAHHVHYRTQCLACVMQIGHAIREPRPQMEQGARRFARHARIAIGRAGDHAFEQGQDRLHAGDLIDRLHQLHFRGAGIRKTNLDATADQGFDQGVGAIHEVISPPIASVTRVRRGSSPKFS